MLLVQLVFDPQSGTMERITLKSVEHLINSKENEVVVAVCVEPGLQDQVSTFLKGEIHIIPLHVPATASERAERATAVESWNIARIHVLRCAFCYAIAAARTASA